MTRRLYIDWARGLAVLLMIEAHTVDAWTRAADRESIGFRNATILGGFAAPLFLWLAGLAVVLSAARTASRGGRAAAVDAVCRRGLEIFILAFLFRIQAFIISPGGPALAIFRVDILNIMGPAIVAAGLVWAAAANPAAQVAVYSAIAAVIALVTPMVRDAAVVDALPTWTQWYIRPAGEFTTFTTFPWSGFLFAGAACGALIAAARDGTTERRLHGWFAAAGLALVASGFFFAARPSIYAHAAFWTSSPTWFAIRVGILMIALSSCFLFERLLARVRALAATRDPIARFGRHSLFVYWIHVELVYGYASWFWRGRVPLVWIPAAYAMFTALIYAATLALDARGPRGRVVTHSAPQPAVS
jgi:uncharacterized membrane protein